MGCWNPDYIFKKDCNVTDSYRKSLKYQVIKEGSQCVPSLRTDYGDTEHIVCVPCVGVYHIHTYIHTYIHNTTGICLHLVYHSDIISLIYTGTVIQILNRN